MNLISTFIILITSSLILSCQNKPVHIDPLPSPKKVAEKPTSFSNTVENGNFSCLMTVRFNSKSEFTVTTKITNNSSKTVTFIDHPDHRSIAVYAMDRNKDNPQNVVHASYVTSIQNLKTVPPGKTAQFTRSFEFKPNLSGKRGINVIDQYSIKDEYIHIWDDWLQAHFSYGYFPDYLPKGIKRNYVKKNIEANVSFKIPE